MKHTSPVVWITGASSGIGEALAKEAARRGASLVLSARRLSELQRLAQELKLPAEQLLILPLDLADNEQAPTWTEKVMQHFGRIDILINNGGISQRAYAEHTSLQIDRQIMEVNYFGTVALSKAVLPVFLKQGNGQYVVISSISGKFGFYLRSAYAASKHALHGFFDSLRMEVYKRNIRVLVVCPGKINTNISLNAVLGDGSKHNQLDQATAKGLSAEVCAKRIWQGIDKREEEIYIGGKELIAVHLKRFFPTLFFKIIRKQNPE